MLNSETEAAWYWLGRVSRERFIVIVGKPTRWNAELVSLVPKMARAYGLVVVAHLPRSGAGSGPVVLHLGEVQCTKRCERAHWTWASGARL